MPSPYSSLPISCSSPPRCILFYRNWNAQTYTRLWNMLFKLNAEVARNISYFQYYFRSPRCSTTTTNTNSTTLQLTTRHRLPQVNGRGAVRFFETPYLAISAFASCRHVFRLQSRLSFAPVLNSQFTSTHDNIQH